MPGFAYADETLKLVTLEYAPYEFQKGDQVKGIAVEILRETFARLDIQIAISVNPWARSLREVKHGRADAIFTIYRTEERETFLTYCDEVLAMQRVGFFARKGRDVAYDGTAQSIAEKKIVVVRGISYGNKFDSMVKNDKLRNIHTVNSFDLAVKILYKGRADLIPGETAVVSSVAAQAGVREDIVLIEPLLQEVPSFIAFSKARGKGDLCAGINKTLKDMKMDGTVQEIYEKYKAL